MAYAKLVFPAGTYSLAKLKEIARFATGQISSTSDLQHASQTLSEIVISDAPGWSLQGGQTFEAQGTATISGYRLQAPCVDASKVKYGLISVYDSRDLYQVGRAGIPNSALYTNLVGSTATSGFLTCQLGSEFSGTTLSNPTWRLQYVVANAYTYGNYRVEVSAQIVAPGPSIGSDTIYIFVSARKLMCIIPEASGRCDMVSILEFPETQSTMRQSNLPAAAFTARYLNVASPHGATETLSNSTRYSYLTYYVYHAFQFTNWNISALGTRVNRNAGDFGTTNALVQSLVPLNITTAGQTAYALIPMTNIRTVYGEGVHNYSSLTDTYMTYKGSTYAGQGDTINVSGVNYVILQIGDSVSNYRPLAIKKG